MKCPRCGSDKTHETNLFECSVGTAMRCSNCYYTWCTQDGIQIYETLGDWAKAHPEIAGNVKVVVKVKSDEF